MGERRVELQQLLTEVRRRWTLRSLLAAWTLGAAVATVLLLACLGAVLTLATDGVALAATTGLLVLAALIAVGWALWPLRRRPTDQQLARFIEERSGGLDDVVVTAVSFRERTDVPGRMRDLLASDALRALRSIDMDQVVSRNAIRQALVRVAVVTVALVGTLAMLLPSLTRATRVITAYVLPARIDIEVTPGSAKLRAGQPITISARLPGSQGAIVPTLTVGAGERAQTVKMEPGDGDRFVVTLKDVKASFPYAVSAGGARSPEYTITIIHPPRVERIDLHFQFPAGLGLAPRVEEDSGDIYGPAGTKVRVSVTTDKPIASGHLAMADGTTLALSGSAQASPGSPSAAQVLEGSLTIEDDGSYRVALADLDGLESPGDTEYFIRTLLDRPPDVRILRPGGDKQVTSLEEVLVEARADDDFGVASLELVFQKPGGPEKALPIKAEGGGLTASGARTLYLEDLGVAPGDFVTYFARARDVGRGRRGSEARSDIFFLEVKPFEEEFVAAQSQAMAMQGGGGSGLQDLAEAQKEIIVATWKLDARARRARSARSEQDVRAIAKAQTELKSRAEQAAGGLAGTPDPRRRRGGGPRPGMSSSGEDPMGKAVDAMGRAAGELDQLKTDGALPHEMEALNQLLKAEAEVRRRQVARQQQAGGGGGMNRQGPDLSTLFDQELRRRQETNYETPNSSETREEEPRAEDPLDKVRELARRQDALNRQQQDLSRNRDALQEEELKRQLERLTREQNELRQQAEELGRQMQQQQQQQQKGEQSESSQQGQQASGQQSQGGRGQQASGRQLREISEDMREAASELRRKDPKQASARGSRAAERLRDLERQMQTSAPDDRRRALGDLQLEARQLADAERRLGNEAARTTPGEAGQDARRRLAGEQERLADRVERLSEAAKRLAEGNQGNRDEQQAVNDAARDLERQRLAERMRQAAEGLRQGSPKQGGDAGQAGQPSGEQQGAQPGASASMEREGDEMARALDRVADHLGAAAGSEGAEARRMSDQLSRTQELRERVADLQRSIEQLQREGQQGQQPGSGAASPQEGRQESPSREGQQPSQGSPASQAQSGQPSPEGREGSSGQQGGADGGRAGRVGQLQREVGQRMREAERLTDQIRRDNPGSMQGPNTPEGWWRSVSAPGTEGFKQDFAKWESLKQHLLLALEQVETDLSDKLRDRENRERLNAGRHEAVPESYREQVERYYRSLAAPRRPPQ